MTSRLKELIIKRAVGQHKDLDGDIVDIFGKKYYVDAFKGEVKEVKNGGFRIEKENISIISW